MTNIGFGDGNYKFAVYIENKPNMTEYRALSTMLPMSLGEIEVINQCCGNGWRKIFNVYAKLLYCLNSQYFGFFQCATTWQVYRDKYLLQTKSQTALLFSPPQLNFNQGVIHIICGKRYAKSLINEDKLNAKLVWLDNDFAIDIKNRLIICPYFDYRQLTNMKIKRLSELILAFK